MYKVVFNEGIVIEDVLRSHKDPPFEIKSPELAAELVLKKYIEEDRVEQLDIEVLPSARAQGAPSAPKMPEPDQEDPEDGAGDSDAEARLQMPLVVLESVNDKLQSALAEISIFTVGDVFDASTEHLELADGIGPATAERIKNEVEEFLR